MKLKFWYSEDDANHFEQLCEQVLNGEAEPPTLLGGGLAYRRWQRKNREFVQRTERIARAKKGIAPVAFEDQLGSADRWGFRGLGSGRARAVSSPQRWQTATSLAAGWQPNVVGAPAPMIGVPIGRHVVTGQDIAYDALSWFQEGITGNPSAFILGLPGLGKSTFVRKIIMGCVAQGQIPIVAGDIKKEHAGFVEQVGGQVITLGAGQGQINPLDAGALGEVIPLLEANRDKLIAEGKEDLIRQIGEKVHPRQMSMVSSLVELGRNEKVKDFEAMLISLGLRELQNRGFTWDNTPLLADLIEVLREGPQSLRDAAAVASDDEWRQRVTPLVLSLNSLMDGATGQIFGGHTTTPINLDATAVCMDVSAVDRGDAVMKAAVVLSAWFASFGAVEAAHTLADAGLRPQKYFALLLDEMWQTLSAARGLVDRVDELSRLNRTDATSVYMITHTSKDLQALEDETDRMKAQGFVERAGAVICGGLPMEELDMLQNVVGFTEGEAERITSWSRGASPKRSRTGGANAVPPGRGRFMIKPSKDGAEGIPVQTELTPTEIEYGLHDTNTRFNELFEKFRANDELLEAHDE